MKKRLPTVRALRARSLPATLCLVVLLTPTLLSRAATAEAQEDRIFRAGAAAMNVTPWLGLSINGGMQDRKVESVRDELHARALVLDNGDDRLAFVVVDSCMIPREIFDEAKRLVAFYSGFPVENMMMSATHTHSAGTAASVFQSDPDREYLEFLTLRIADAVRQAIRNLEPAEIGWGVGQVPEHVHNRRWHMREGTIPPNPFGQIDQVRMNPPVAGPDLIKPAGPTDPDVSVISVRSREGRPMALLANYSLHYVGGTGGGVSADYFGAFARRIEELLGAGGSFSPFVGILSNGASGDINNVHRLEAREPQPPFGQIRRVANRVAAEALSVYERIEHRPWVPLGALQTEIELGVRRPSSEELARARRLLMEAKGPNMRTRDEIYARESHFLAEYPPTVSLILQAFRIGDLAVAAIPCEVFVEIGLELRERSPFDTTFTISLANGYNGYLPTPEHHRLGGYETWRARSSYLEAEASPKVVRELLSLFGGLQ